MAFQLNDVVPWGRNMEEYRTMFLLDDFETRIFPVVDLDASRTEMISDVICELEKTYDVELKETDYQFQKNANKMLLIRK